MGAVRRDSVSGERVALRSRSTGNSYWGSLYVREPQAGLPPSDPDSDDGEEDDSDDDEDDEDEDDTSQPIITLTHAPPAQDTSRPSQIQSTQTSLPSQTEAATTSEPTLLPSTSTTIQSRPSETSLSDELSETIEGIVITTTTAPAETTNTAAETVTATPDSELAAEEASSGDSNRAADFGIILGTLALAALLIGAGVFFFRWRRSKNMSDPELARPSSNESDQAGLISGPQMQEQQSFQPTPSPPPTAEREQRGLEHYSSWAQFDPRPSAQQQPMSFYNGDERSSLDRPAAVTAAADPFPALPATAYNPYQREFNDGGSVPETPNLPSGGRDPGFVGAAYAGNGMHVARYSYARTEAPEEEEGTWRTWGVDQGRATQEKGMRERFLR